MGGLSLRTLWLTTDPQEGSAQLSSAAQSIFIKGGFIQSPNTHLQKHFIKCSVLLSD